MLRFSLLQSVAVVLWKYIACLYLTNNTCIEISHFHIEQSKLFLIQIQLYNKSNEITIYYICKDVQSGLAHVAALSTCHTHVHIQLLETRSSLDKFKHYKENSLFSPLTIERRKFIYLCIYMLYEAQERPSTIIIFVY